MFRFALVPIFAALLAMPGNASAQQDATALSDSLRLRDVFSVIAEEGRAYGADLENEMFPDNGGVSWDNTVSKIYAVDRILPIFAEAFSGDLALSKGDTNAMLAYFRSDLGRRVTELEISARRALLDQTVEDASRLKYEEMQAIGDPRLELIEEFVTVNDLVESNVSGGMNANYAFYRGLEDAGGMPRPMSEEEILSDVWSQEEVIREETSVWVHSYLAMAYAPLSDAELHAYIDFSNSQAGRDLNRALFAGFDAVFVDVSRKLGQAAGVYLTGQEL